MASKGSLTCSGEKFGRLRKSFGRVVGSSLYKKTPDQPLQWPLRHFVAMQYNKLSLANTITSAWSALGAIFGVDLGHIMFEPVLYVPCIRIGFVLYLCCMCIVRVSILYLC